MSNIQKGQSLLTAQSESQRALSNEI